MKRQLLADLYSTSSVLVTRQTSCGVASVDKACLLMQVTNADADAIPCTSSESVVPSIVYHLIEASNWPFIEKEGLLSASALLRTSSLSSEKVEDIERNQRPQRLVLPDGRVLRDQKPLPAVALQRCLVDCEPADWYKLINSKVYFWVDLARLNRVRRAILTSPQVVLKVDASALLAQYGSKAAVTPYNIGNAMRKASRRSRATLVPYATWQVSGWDSESAAVGGRPRSRCHTPAELVVDDAVPDIMQFVLEVRKLAPGELMA